MIDQGTGLTPLKPEEPFNLKANETRAGDRDRTGITSLEGWDSTIELRPRG